MPNFEPRGNTNYRREEDLFTSRILNKRSEDQRFPGQTAREDSEAELVRQEIRDKTPDLQRIAKMVVVAGGAAAVGKAIGRKNMIGMMSWVSTHGYSANKRVFQPIRHLVDDMVLGQGPAARSISRRYLGASTSGAPSRLDPDLSMELERMYSKYSANGPDSITWLHGPNRTGVDYHRQYLSARFSGRTAPDGLQHLTVGDVLGSSNIRDRFSSNSIKVLQQARRHGVIHDAMSVSSSNTFGLFKNSTGNILDSQAFSPLRVFDAAHSALRQFTIPFFELRPADLIFGAIRPMLVPSRHTTIGGGQRLPNGSVTGRGLNFSMGDTIFSQVPGLNRFTAVARGVKTYDISGEGSHFYGRAVAIKQGRIASEMNRNLQGNFVPRNTQPIKHFWQRVQETIGVGPEFATNRSIFGLIKDAAQRHSIDRGNSGGAFLPNRFMPRHATMTRRQVIQAQSAFNQGLLPNQALYSNAQEYLDEAIPSPAGPVPLYERIKAKLFDNSRSGSYYSRLPSAGFPGEKIGEVPNPRTPKQGYTLVAPGAVPIVGPGGVPASTVPATGVVDSPGFMNSANLFLHHGVERLNQLIGTTTGFGIRPSSGTYGWIGSLAKVYGGAFLAKMGLEYAKYSDYIAGEALDFVPGLDNTTPSEYAVRAYSGSMVLRQKLREQAGIQQLAAYSESLMPGSMNLPGMTMARTAGPVALGALLSGRRGAMLGSAVSAIIGGLDPDIKSQELADIYSGRKKIPVMKSRGWMMGLQPFGGDEIDYYRPHWAARYLSNYRYTDTQYGSKAEYFGFESSAPTPHNLFGILKLANPDYYAEKHYYNRPYPFSTTGERMHEGEEFVPPPSPGAYWAQALGYSPTPGTYTTGVNPNSSSGLLRRGMDQITQLGGFYKFAAQQIPFYDDLFGGKAELMYAAQAGTITSASREFYDESVGGLFGMTELLRRFMSPDKGRQGINMLPNTMPTWLPGMRSEYPNDQDYFTDFTTGDPYARISSGESRLPGPGYEALAELHSKTPGVYDAYDRYKILADVAPYSEAFKNYRTIVQSWALAGVLDKTSMQDFLQTEGEVRSILDGPEFTPRRFSGVRSGTPEQLAEVNKFSIPEQYVGAAWEHLTHDIVPNIGRTVPVLGTIFDRKLMGQRSAYESYLEDQVYGTDFHDWRKPYESMVEPRLQNLAASNPITATAGGLGLGLAFGATPLGAAVGAVGGLTLGISSTARMISTGQVRGGWKPDSFDQQNELESYFDSLEYKRAEINMRRSEEIGREDLANRFKFQMGRTSVGTNYQADDIAFMNAAKFRLGSPMKKYAWQFLQAPESSRAALMSVSPDMAQPLLSSAWSRQGDKRFQRYPSNNVEQRSADIIANYGMPPSDWAGWSPDIPMKSIKIKTLDSYFNEAYDMHRYNLWEADRRTFDRNSPGLASAF
jgi:hypothetical protein